MFVRHLKLLVIFSPDDPECPNLPCARPWEQRAHWKHCSPVRIPPWSFIHPHSASYLLSDKVLGGVSWDRMPPPLTWQGRGVSRSAFRGMAAQRTPLVNFIHALFNLTRPLMTRRNPTFSLSFIGWSLIIIFKISSAAWNDQSKQLAMTHGGIEAQKT